MTTPNSNELIFYTNQELTDTDWRTNWLKVIEWLTSGNYDASFNNIIANGNITAANFIGNGSQITGINIPLVNYLLNSEAKYITSTTSPLSISLTTYKALDDRWYIKADGSSISSGDIYQYCTQTWFTFIPHIGRSGYAWRCDDVTLSGTGILYLRYRMQARTASIFKDQIASFQSLAWQDTGGAINYTIYVRKADAIDDFTTTTEISNSGQISVADQTGTKITFENISMGDCVNGIEIEIKVECGAVTSKNFEFTEMQFELGELATSFSYDIYENQYTLGTYDQKFKANTYITGTTEIEVLSSLKFAASIGITNIPSVAFNPIDNTQDYNFDEGSGVYSNTIRCNAIATTIYMSAPLKLTDDSILTQLDAYWYRDDALSTGNLSLYRVAYVAGTRTLMATLSTTSTGGDNTVTVTTITNPTIDNNNYYYVLQLELTSNDSTADVYFKALEIRYTVTSPVP